MPIVQVSVWEGLAPENKKKIIEGITNVFEDIGVPKEAVQIVIYEAPMINWATGGQLHSERYPHKPSSEKKEDLADESTNSKMGDEVTSAIIAKSASNTSLQNREFVEALLRAEELKTPIDEEVKTVDDTVILENERDTKLYKDRFIHGGKTYLISEMSRASTKAGFLHSLLEIQFKNGEIHSFYVGSLPNTSVTNAVINGLRMDYIKGDFKEASEQWASAINVLISLSDL
jgi:4-oxalocrotonate tautomerase